MEDNIKSEPSGAAQNGAGAKKPGNKGRGGKNYKKYGKGGGRPDNAMAGIGKTYMIDEALLALSGIVKELIGG